MPKQIVVGCYSTDIKWKVPKGIDLNDKGTYEFWDKYGTLYIRNLKTEVIIEVESYEESAHDHKRADSVCVTDSEDDSEEEEEK
jgi:hypothetical protein